MTNEVKNKIRALILLMVFSLNTIVGFACSVGVSMGYNKKHHEHGHHHKHGKNHVHHHVNNLEHGDFSAGIVIKAPVDDCCAGQVTSFAKLDKSVSYNNLLIKVPVFLQLAYNNFLTPNNKEPQSPLSNTFGIFRRSCFLNDISIRIAIQSFQI